MKGISGTLRTTIRERQARLIDERRGGDYVCVNGSDEIARGTLMECIRAARVTERAHPEWPLDILDTSTGRVVDWYL